MVKKIIVLLMVDLFINLIINSPITVARTQSSVNNTSTQKIQAKQLPEVEINTTQEFHKGKILSMEAKKVNLLPFPYWNVKSMEIDIDGISSITIMKQGGRAGKGFLWGFALGFLIAGIGGGASAEYDEDYGNALGGGFFVGLFGGLVGALIGWLSSKSSPSEYKFHEMSEEDKINTLQNIMGL